ncbi:B12 binding protein [Mumia flava]|uniref:B12 binding protein n=1 Tax=Mumia flava TaxID=1348852 RepID=A0A2M9BHB9_9ACTN|nr:MerR family transcriptional regulator [Mumia flava]PJJ57341.1 B12 binding protein [Mumia flava]
MPTQGTTSVRDAAARLGLPAATLRTWERRYGLGPSARSAGGHRRYSEDDLAVLGLMARLVRDGMQPRDAAEAARGSRGSAGPLIISSGKDQANAELVAVLLAAAQRHDAATLRRHVTRVAAQRGALRAWDEILVPLLRAIGERWRDPDFGIAGEHLASEVITSVLRTCTALAARDLGAVQAARSHEVLLASAEEEQHALPLAALEAALAQQRIGCRMLGARTPARSLVSEVARTQPCVVFVWASMPYRDPDVLRDLVDAASGELTVLLGGPGWARTPRPDSGPRARVAEVTDLPGAVESVASTIGVELRAGGFSEEP